MEDKFKGQGTEITVKEILETYIPMGRNFHFMTPAGYVDLTTEEAGQVLQGAVNPKRHPGAVEHKKDYDRQELLNSRCHKDKVHDTKINGVMWVLATVYY